MSQRMPETTPSSMHAPPIAPVPVIVPRAAPQLPATALITSTSTPASNSTDQTHSTRTAYHGLEGVLVNGISQLVQSKKSHVYRTKPYKAYMTSLGKQTYSRTLCSKF